MIKLNSIISILDCADSLENLHSELTTILKYIMYVGPVLVVVLSTIDYLKAALNSDNDALKKANNKFIKRIIAAILLFFIPILVNTTVNLVLSSDKYDFCEESDSFTPSYRPKVGKESSETNESVDVNNFDTTDFEYDSTVVENLAAFMASEAGVTTGGTPAQLLTGSVYINNFYVVQLLKNKKAVNYANLSQVINTEVNTTNMCTTFSYKNLYTSKYCNLTFKKLEGIRKTSFNETQKTRMLTLAKILLSKKFTIPWNITYQASKEIIKKDKNAIMWGPISTGISKYPAYFGCPGSYKVNGGIDTLDVYGNQVSNTMDYYVILANQIEEEYLK